jgi:VWFA-related protein
MNAKSLISGLIIVALWGVAPLVARQQTPPAGTPVFKAKTDLVLLQVNVFNGHSDAVPDLPKSTFQILEDGKPQPITFFSSGDVPVAVGLVIDNSTSMLTRRSMVVAGGRTFAESSHPDDQAFTIVFNENVRDGLPGRMVFTQSRPILEASLLRYPPGGLTAVYDAVIAGLDRLQQATLQKKVLLVLSDGKDNASSHSKQDMLHRAMRSDALIYSIYTGDLASDPGDNGVMKRLAALSGGVAYSPDTEMQAIVAFKTIADNIRRGYSLGYVPANVDGEYHRVKVLVRAPGLKNLSVRVRDGYAISEPVTR